MDRSQSRGRLRSYEAKRALEQSLREAVELGHSAITTDHLPLGCWPTASTRQPVSWKMRRSSGRHPGTGPGQSYDQRPEPHDERAASFEVRPRVLHA